MKTVRQWYLKLKFAEIAEKYFIMGFIYRLEGMINCILFKQIVFF